MDDELEGEYRVAPSIPLSGYTIIDHGMPEEQADNGGKDLFVTHDRMHYEGPRQYNPPAAAPVVALSSDTDSGGTEEVNYDEGFPQDPPIQPTTDNYQGEGYSGPRHSTTRYPSYYHDLSQQFSGLRVEMKDHFDGLAREVWSYRDDYNTFHNSYTQQVADEVEFRRQQRERWATEDEYH